MSDIAGWGIGINKDENGEVTSYGFPSSLDPERFMPDHEMCSAEELKKHEQDLNKKKDK